MPEKNRKNSRVSLYCLVTFCGKRWAGTSAATLANLSLGGCFISCDSVPPPGEQFKLTFGALGRNVNAVAVVRWVLPGVGFGCQFMRMDLHSSQSLHGIVCHLRGENAPLLEMTAIADR